MDNNNEKFVCAKMMGGKKFCEKFLLDYPILATLVCKELWSICSDYDDGMAHSK